MKHIAPYSIFISGVCIATFSHYAEIWVFGYMFSAFFALLYSIIGGD